jgi:hypothetical protein
MTSLLTSYVRASLVMLSLFVFAEIAPAQNQTPANVGPATWTDPDTGLMWTIKDSGSVEEKIGLDWKQALSYCAQLQTGGYSDWRLPTIDELEGIYDPNIDIPVRNPSNGWVVHFHVKGNLQLSGWHWSSSPGNGSGEAWFFDYIDENLQRGSALTINNALWRALCVRRSGR